ncbi:uncharacterized protein METZ01_LOCUS51098 [marine metagenome]|uniref:Uncharacterized protein n=1 Tax=marine metagenome TaxID=408172 RepID=A0A381S485_9ZZZZ
MSGQLSAASGQLFWVWLLWLLAFHLPFEVGLVVGLCHASQMSPWV